MPGYCEAKGKAWSPPNTFRSSALTSRFRCLTVGGTGKSLRGEATALTSDSLSDGRDEEHVEAADENLGGKGELMATGATGTGWPTFLEDERPRRRVNTTNTTEEMQKTPATPRVMNRYSRHSSDSTDF